MKALENFKIVLVSPLYGGNIGSVCRAMMNAGMTDLAIVNPREGTDWEMATRMAYRANSVLENHKQYNSIEEAVADCSFVAGTSARTGLYRNHAFSAKDIAPMALESADKGNKVALVFGPEDSGLNNDDLKVCTHILQIPSHEMYESLNLSHAVMVCVYEIFAQSEIFEASSETSPECTIELRERMFEKWEEVMARTHFAEPHKLEHMMLGLRRILSRGQLTECDARILIGLARQTLWVTDNWEKSGKPGL